jgi:transcription-repair coupling factor (superfamily II helicase)
MVDPHKHLTPNAAKRLRAIEEYSELGAGFALAMRDLEIRGAGNLLGHQQSGHIAAVGYELYCQLLEGAVRSLKQLPRRLSVEVDIDLPGEAYLPDRYIPEMRLKLDLYRRLRRADSYPALAELRAELLDRFGPPPPPVLHLLDLAELRLDATVWRISAISTEGQYLVLAFPDQQPIEQLARQSRGQLRIVDPQHAYLRVTAASTAPAAFFEAAKSVLRASSTRQ